MTPDRSCILTINGGSSSLKFALFSVGEPPRRLGAGRVERIGLPGASMTVVGGEGEGQGKEVREIAAADHDGAVAAVIEWLGQGVGLEGVGAIGHRVVHGGPRYSGPERITPEVVEELRRISPFDPEHMPAEIDMIEAFTRLVPDRPQVACFDTAFHAGLPTVARLLPIPRKYEAEGVRRYGFHGLSYTYLMDELARVAGAEAARGRVVLAHLGAGASLAAVRDGRCVDTSMAFTPTAGLVMGTRTGDLDPGLVLYLERVGGLSVEAFHHMVNHESGLLGVSETSPDVRDLLARRAADPRAAEAIDLFCYQARKWIGAFAAALGGLETLVFSGGIGENAPEVRAEICAGLGFLGVVLDDQRNAASSPVISSDSAPATVRMIRTDEEVTIARLVANLISRKADPGSSS